jgi:hypothetical protein
MCILRHIVKELLEYETCKILLAETTLKTRSNIIRIVTLNVLNLAKFLDILF